MAKSISVRQRSLLAVKSALEGITKDNGYDTTIKHVRIPGDISGPRMRNVDPPEVWIIPGVETASMRSIGSMWVCMPVKLLLFLRWRSDDPDGAMDMFASQVKRRIILGMRDSGFVDSLGTSNRLVKVINKSGYNFRRYTDIGADEGFIIGSVEFEIEYSHLISDPRLWDSTDSLVEES